MKPIKPIKPNHRKLKHKYNHKKRKYIYYLQLSKKYNNKFKQVIRQLKWNCLIKQYKIHSKKKRMTFRFKKAMLKANYINALFIKHHIITKEISNFMIPSKHNPYKNK